jgi:Arc/MetJ-type ribon-helix-helix transcriptional regulator
LNVSKTVSLELEDINKIQKLIERKEVSNLSEFVQKAVKNELKKREQQINYEG